MRKLFFLSLLIFSISCATTETTIIKDRPASYSYTPTAPSASKKKYYIVKKGDSLWRISKRYGVSVNTLMRDNQISSPQDLKVGQKILIPSTRRRKSSSSFLWPIEGEVVNFFGESVNNSVNKGLNIKATSGNRQVSASAQGKAVFCDNLKGWGKTIILEHDPNFYTIYANLDDTAIQEGSFAKKGQLIGEVAAERNGNYILHFEIRKNYIPQDPMQYIN